MDKKLLKHSEPIKQLDMIVDQTLDFVADGEREISDIKKNARQEYDNLEKELIYLKVETATLITSVDRLYQMYDINRKKLLNAKSFTEEELRSLHRETEQLRVRLEKEKDRESLIIRRRNDLEIQLRSTKDLNDKAEALSADFHLVVSLLNGNIKQITDTIEDINNKQALGIKILQVQEEERRRIAREMHDGIAQQLSQVLINAEFSVKLLDKDINLAKRELNALKVELRGSISSIRQMIYNLRPMSLDDLGLIPTIKREVDLFQTANPNIKLDLAITEELDKGEVDFSETVVLTVYRIFQEAISNIKKHSKAKNAKISLSLENQMFYLEVVDDGVGILPTKREVDSKSENGFGLSIMRERVDLLRGKVEILPNADGGTAIKICIPIASPPKLNA